MITTDTVVGGAIGLTDDELDPYVTLAPPRRLPTKPGLPAEGALLGLGALVGAEQRGVAELADDVAALSAELRDQLVAGAVRACERGLEPIVLDGTPGRVGGTALHRDPALMGLSPSAPPLEVLLRFAAATEELAAARGQFASLEARFGPRAVERASAQLTAVFERGAGAGGVPPYWKAAALVRPLARIAGPGAGLVLDLPRRLLDQEFGVGGIVRFEEVDFPSTLTHGPTRRFLRETGLPEDGILFGLDTEVALPTLAEYGAGRRPGGFSDDGLAAGADRLIRLGHLTEDTGLVVDGTTGAVLAWTESDLTLRPLNADVSTLAFSVWLLHRVRTLTRTHGLATPPAPLAASLTRTTRDALPTTAR
ncbi:SUKH-4 family immunity protein [Streptomyces sp. NPDC005551]|uniref:SUKH-4 family immunity protein n=1 Tax=Streptomyces sp. NPDC005551 TaxID=3364725 RepID=UPI003682E4EA